MTNAKVTRDEWTMKVKLSLCGPSYSPTPFESRWVRAEWADAEIERLTVDRNHWERMARTPAEGDPLVTARAEIERLRGMLMEWCARHAECPACRNMLAAKGVRSSHEPEKQA